VLTTQQQSFWGQSSAVEDVRVLSVTVSPHCVEEVPAL
jgi:hypothetical protein